MKASTTSAVVEKLSIVEKEKVYGRVFIQKTQVPFRKSALEKLKKMGPYGEVLNLENPNDINFSDKKWARYNQGIAFDEENLESLIKDKLFKDKDQAKLAKLEKEKKEIGEPKDDTKKKREDKYKMMGVGSTQIGFRVTDVYFYGNLESPEVFKENEEKFRQFVDQVRKEVEEKTSLSNVKPKLHFRTNRKRNTFNGTINFNFDDQNHANEFFNVLDGKDFNNFILRPEWIEQRKY